MTFDPDIRRGGSSRPSSETKFVGQVQCWRSHEENVATIRYDTIRYIYVRSKADEMARLV